MSLEGVQGGIGPVAMKTPWGHARDVELLAEGLSWVLTERGGGFICAESFACKHLSPAARQVADRWHRYYVFDQRAAWTVLLLEVPQFLTPVCERLVHGVGIGVVEYAMNVLSQSHPGYLASRGIVPDESAAAKWRPQQRTTSDPKAAARHAKLGEKAMRGGADAAAPAPGFLDHSATNLVVRLAAIADELASLRSVGLLHPQDAGQFASARANLDRLVRELSNLKEPS